MEPWTVRFKDGETVRVDTRSPSVAARMACANRWPIWPEHAYGETVECVVDVGFGDTPTEWDAMRVTFEVVAKVGRA